MSQISDSDRRIDRLERAVKRLERALGQLAAGVDWSTQRGARGRADLNEICGELQTARDVEALKQRAATLETELAEVRAA